VQEVKESSFGSKFKKAMALMIVLLLLGLCFFYMSKGARIARQTVLMPWIPELGTYIAFASLVGLVFAGRTFYSRPDGKSLKRLAESFFGGFCLSFFLSLNIYQVCVYLLPGDLVQYEAAYELRFPGPSLGRTNRCEAGLGFKDLNTDRWIVLCTDNLELSERRKRGMNALWVTAHSNKLGSYIVRYEFIYK
jgi:hypothetical protein